MTEQTNGFVPSEASGKADNAWTAGPKDFIFRYLHYLPWIIISTGLFLTLAYIKIRYSTPIFRVQSSLLIKDDRGNDAGKDARFNELFMSETSPNLSNEIEILRSRPVLERVARDLGLQMHYYNEGNVKSSLMYPDPPFFLDSLSITDSSRSFGFKITVVNDSSFLLNEAKTKKKFGEMIDLGSARCRLVRNQAMDIRKFGSVRFDVSWEPLLYAAENLAGGLTIAQTNERSTILNLTFESENSSLAKDVLNTLMAVYDSMIVEDKGRINANTLRFINAQLYLLSDTLSGVQGGLKDYMVENHIFDIEGQSKDIMQGLGESLKDRGQQAVKLSVITWLMEYIGDKKNAYELVPTVLGIEEPALLQLVNEYNRLQLERATNLRTTSPDNPLILALETSLDKTRRNIYQALLNVKQAYLIEGANLDKYNQELQDRVTGLPGKSMHMLNIERRQKILEELYSFLLQKKLETSIASASTVSNSKALEPAVGPGAQVSPETRKIYSVYFFFGMLLPLGIIVLIELMRDKVASRKDVEKNTNTPILGEIGHSNNEQTLIVVRNSRRFISEQFRIIRTNLQYIVSKREKMVIMVTSSFSGEGKSFVSTNMGAVMALSERTTVIMEFDIRKPKIVSGLDLKRKMGITNYIIGNAEFEDLPVKVDGVDNLYVIPCGPIPPNPAELLLDPRLDELMKEVLKRFDIVIMDTAPVGLVSDAVNLARFADCTLYIVRQNYTFRKQLGMIEQLYTQRKLPNLSILLNDVKPQGGYYGGSYGGYGYHRRGYGYGIESGYFEEEKAAKDSSVFKRFNKWRKQLFS